MVEISCIIINYNTADLTCNAVQTLLKHNDSYLNLEIIVVDNASKFDDYLLLKKNLSAKGFKNIQLVKSDLNLGFGGGNMLGIKHSSKSKYFVFLNSDTIHFQNGALKKMFDYMETHRNIAICGPQMLDENGLRRISFDHFSSLKREIFKRYLLEKLFPNNYVSRKKIYSKPVKVDYVQGAFMLVRAPEFLAIGGFDTNLFLYYEESDISIRFKRILKLDTIFFPSASYIHLVSRSVTKDIDIKVEQKLSLLYHTEKHYGSIHRHILLTYLIIRYSFTTIFKIRYYKLLKVFLNGGGMSHSIRYK